MSYNPDILRTTELIKTNGAGHSNLTMSTTAGYYHLVNLTA